MGASLRRLVCLAVLTVSTVAFTGCDTINPFMPKARVLVTATPQISTLKITYDEATQAYQKETTESKFSLAHETTDITPSVQFNWYEIKFYDQSNQEISASLVGSDRQLGTSAYLKGGSSSQAVQVQAAIFNDILVNYGILNGFVKDSSDKVSVNTQPWSDAITGRIIFHGTDQNGNSIAPETKFTVKFEVAINKATTTTGGN